MQRFILAILVCFWGFMGFRLWQVEYGGKRLGAAVDIAIVWDKMLNAQDEAPLAIVNEHTGEMHGWLNWAPSVTRDDTVERGEVDGMVDTVLDYSLDVENARLFGRGASSDVNFRLHLGFGPPPERAWTDVQLMVQAYEPVEIEFNLHAQSTNEFFTATLQGSGNSNEVKLLYNELKKPDKLVKAGLDLAGFSPIIASTASAMVKQVMKNELPDKPVKVKLPEIRQAHFDRLPGVRSDIKVYRVDVPMGNDVFIKVYISMMGEVLRVEIPEILMDAVAKVSKLNLPKSIVMRNENYYGRSKRQRNR